MFEYDRDLNARHVPFATWGNLLENIHSTPPSSESESDADSKTDINVNSTWDFPPLGSCPTPQRNTNPWKEDAKSYSEAVQPRPQLAVSEDSKAVPQFTAIDDGFSDSEIEDFARFLSSPRAIPPQHYLCNICSVEGHYIEHCPNRHLAESLEFTPYQGKKRCYGAFQCSNCRRKWNSMGSVANEAQQCVKCQVMSFPHKQLPHQKAMIRGLIKKYYPAQKVAAPIGHERARRTFSS